MVLQSRSERELNIFVVKTVRTHTTHKALVSAAPSLKYSRVMNRLNVELMSTSSCTQSSAILPLTSAVTSRAGGGVDGGGVDGRWWYFRFVEVLVDYSVITSRVKSLAPL